MHEAERMLETLPVSSRVICRAHEVLLDSVRGAGKHEANGGVRPIALAARR